MGILGKLRAMATRGRREDELREEIEQHIAQRRQSLIDEGMDPRDAAYEARRMFGNVTVIREETRDMWSVRWLDTIAQDLRYGLRLLRRSPIFTATAIASLSLGIGAAAAVFSLTDALFLRRLPVKAPEQLVLFRWVSGPQMVFESLNGNGTQNETGLSSTSFSYLAYDTVRTRLANDVDVFAFADLYRANLAVDGRPETASAQIVSGNYFDVLGLTPAAGRLLGAADDRSDAPPAAVLGYDMWMRRFGGSPDVIGRPLVLNGISFTVAGVLPRGFSGTLQVGQPCDVIVPLAFYKQVTHAEENLNDPNHWWVLMMGRLKGDASIARVQPVADSILKQTVSASKADLKPEALPRMVVEPGDRGQTETRTGLVEPMRLMAGVVAVVLLVACANVANLLLARGRARARELAVRCAIGAPRRRIIRQLLTEGLLLGAIASAIGVVAARWITSALLPALTTDSSLEIAFGLNARMLGFTCLLAVVCSVAFAVAPAVQASSAQITTGLQESSRGNIGSRRRFSAAGTLVVVQVALSVLLVSAAGLLSWSAWNLRSINTGFDASNVLMFTVDTALNAYAPAKSRAFFEESLVRLRALPGVTAASFSSHRLVANSSILWVARPEGAPAPLPSSPDVQAWAATHQAYLLYVDDAFYSTLRIPLLRGRALDHTDTADARRVAVINAALARQLFGTEDVVGKRLITGLDPKAVPTEIVGVCANAIYTSIRVQNAPIVYVPYRQGSLGRATFMIKTNGEPSAITSAARDALRSIDPTVPIYNVRSLEEQILLSLERERMFAKLALLLGGVALALSAIGLYGLLAYAVTRRTPEIGVRMALGAERAQVRWMVLRQSLLLVTVGLVIGIPAAAASTKFLETMLFGLQSRDVRVFAASAIVMLVVALAAAYAPARRASRIDPLTALRAE
jgi:predicted permease